MDDLHPSLDAIKNQLSGFTDGSRGRIPFRGWAFLCRDPSVDREEESFGRWTPSEAHPTANTDYYPGQHSWYYDRIWMDDGSSG